MGFWRIVLLSGFLALLGSPAYAQVITTIAGNVWVFPDGLPAINTPFSYVSGLAADPVGGYYVADGFNNIVVKVSPSGISTIVAGTRGCGYAGDGGPATSADLCYPRGLALDRNGNLYIADFYSSRVRKIAANGVITTVAGTGVYGFSGDGGPATSAMLSSPYAVAVDNAGNLFISDSATNRVRKVTPAGIITTVAGTGVEGFSGDGGPGTAAQISPSGLAVDAAGNLLIAANGRVRQVTPAGIITTYAGGGSAAPNNVVATAANLDGATGLALDASGNLFVTLSYRHLICKISVAGIVTTVAGNGTGGFSGDGGQALAASFNNPESLTVDSSGSLYIADTRNARVRRADGAGVISTVAGNQGYRFAGDGGPAINAYLQGPLGLAVDAAGNLYIADEQNHRIRKVAPNGTISTFAGNGSTRNSGDGGPATAAGMDEPHGLALDAAGNLYFFDDGINTVRKVTPAGIITTVAGGNGEAFSGDGGPATSAGLDPWGLAVDSAGNLYIAGNLRVRRVAATTGIITTIAGNGVSGSSGDGGPATAAMFKRPSAVVVDASGNVFVADQDDHRIRKITPAGIISTVAGTGVESYSGDGGPAVSATLARPVGLALDAAGNLYIAASYNNRIRRVTGDGIINTVAGGGNLGDGNLATQAYLETPNGIALDAAGNLYITTGDVVRKVLGVPPSFSVAPLRIDITSPAGTPGVVTQQIVVSSLVSGLPWTVQATTQEGSWLAASPAAGIVPGTANVSVNPASLSPGIYQGSVVVTIPRAGPTTQTIPVTLTVTPAKPAEMKVTPAALTFALPVGGTTSRQTLTIGNAGTGTVSWTAEAASGGNWLSVETASGTATFVSSGTLAVAVNASGLSAGVYSGSVTIRSAATSQTIKIPVTLSVVVPTQTILLGQSGLLFTGVEGGRLLSPQTVGVANTGLVSSMNWTTEVTTLSGGSWLSATPTSGTSLAGSQQVPLVSVYANANGLSAGSYSGQVRIRATGADNSPQIVTVILSILPPGSKPNAKVRPSGLIFVARVGGTSPPPQIVQVSTASPVNVEFVAGVQTAAGGSWLTAAPANARISADTPKEMIVRPVLGSLGPGLYQGSVNLLFSDSTPPQVVDVYVLVLPAGTEATPMRVGSADGCTPKSLFAVSRTLSGNFSSPAGWPISVEAQVIDDCGNAVANATVVTSFSNGDPPITLASLGNGVYSGTWRPLNPSSQVVTTVQAILPPLTPAKISLQGQVGSSVLAPTVYSGGVVNAASYATGSVLAPGSIVSLFGSSMAQASGGASSLPLPTALNGASVTIGGIASPLFYAAPGQVNAQIPFEISPNTRPQVVLSTGSALAVPETITIADVRPGIFTVDTSGTGQGAITHPSGAFVDSKAPAAAGDVVVVYCNGLGATNPSVTSGNAAPGAEPLARAVVVPSATVGGQPAPIQFAGLVPGFVGLYQVNVQIPAGVSAGPAIQLVLTQNGVASNTVTLAIR